MRGDLIKGGCDYQAGDYRTMTVYEKIDFLHKVHQEKISLWDEDGNDNEIWNDYHNVEDELLHYPQWLGLEDILHIMGIFDDNCYEISWQFNLAKMITNSICYHGKDGVTFYLQHLQAVPEQGRLHGWHFPVQWLLHEDSYQILKEAVQEQNTETKKVVLQILEDIEIYQDQKKELIEVINS